MSEASSVRPYFYGSAENRLNTKGQVAIPKRFRAVVSQEACVRGFVLTRGEADCIYMYTHEQFGVIKDRVRELARQESDPEFFRCFMEGAFAVDLDSQGRFVLPATLRKSTGLEGPVVLFIGMDDRIEIWSPEKRERSRGDKDTYEKRREYQARQIFGL